jgi:hypothetical protein
VAVVPRNLPSINIELNEKEMDAVQEYARQCGESIQSLVRKLVIRDATLADGYGADDSSYDFRIILPSENSSSADRARIQDTYNRVRRILGWKEIQL